MNQTFIFTQSIVFHHFKMFVLYNAKDNSHIKGISPPNVKCLNAIDEQIKAIDKILKDSFEF